jgi:hypothetical protein
VFLQLLCAFCCFVDASPRFCYGVPLCCATSAVVCVSFAPPVRLYLVFLRASVRRFVLFWGSVVGFSGASASVASVVSCFLASVVLWCWCPGFVVCWVFGVWLVFFCLWWFWCVVSGPLFGGWLLRVWLVVVVCVSRVLSGCCSSVGSVLFWVVRCFAPGVFRVWLLVCFSSWLVHVAPGSCVAPG